ncbi:MAG: hypothetical protein V1799_01565 [bacterium]
MQMKQVKNFFVGSDVPPDYVSVEQFIRQVSGKLREEQFEETIASITKRAQSFSSNEDFWKRLMLLRQQAYIAAVDKNWFLAQQYTTEMSVLVNRAITSESLKLLRLRLAVAPLFWIILLYLIEMFVAWMPFRVHSLKLVPEDSFQYLWLGLFGGTTIVWWGIVKHATDLTFDGSFAIWYFLKPAIGAIMGIVLVFVVQAGFITLQGNTNILNKTPLLLVAFLGGFSERFFIQAIDKVITAILGGGQPSSPPSPVMVGSSSPSPKTPTQPSQSAPAQPNDATQGQKAV